MSEYIYEHKPSGADHMGKPVELPTLVQREEIVRCRDCVHAEPEGEPPRKGCEGLLWCDYLTEGIGFSVLPHNFCAWGKRKEGVE